MAAGSHHVFLQGFGFGTFRGSGMESGFPNMGGVIDPRFDLPDDHPDWIAVADTFAGGLRFTRNGLYLVVCSIPTHVSINSDSDWFGREFPGVNTGAALQPDRWPDGIHVQVRSLLTYADAVLIGT